MKNPILWMDYPDPDVIRVGNTWYMINTTMHLMPGGEILRSGDLTHWEHVTWLYEVLEDSPGARLEDGKGIYSAGMWAATLRYHSGRFYVIFVSNDTREQGVSFLFTAENIEGPWEKRKISGFYHDCSLLFDEDRAYIVSGNGQLRLTEMLPDLSGPKPGGINKIIVTDTDYVSLKCEGVHFYKINGKYYIFGIHWLKYGSKRRTEVCYIADRVDGPYAGNNVLDDDMGYHNAGVAQGALTDTPDGRWFAMLFQDHGAVGRVPVLMPVTWDGEWPVFGNNGKVPLHIETGYEDPQRIYVPLYGSDGFDYAPGEALKSYWQWNHIPDPEGWSLTECPGKLRIRSRKTVKDIQLASNMLGQRCVGPRCEADVLMDFSALKDGDRAGLCVMQGLYAWIGAACENDKRYLVMAERDPEKKDKTSGTGAECVRIPLDGNTVRLKAKCDFVDNRDTVELLWLNGTEWKTLGPKHKLFYTLEHFMGARLCLFMYSEKETGGWADFDDFRLTVDSEEALPESN